jgi:hypothetical protein
VPTSGQKLILGLLAIITLEVVPFRWYALLPALLSFVNASWKSCSVRVFSTACDHALNTSILSKWRPFSFIFNRGSREKKCEWGVTVMLFLVKIPG